jgi:hypothetical protein
MNKNNSNMEYKQSCNNCVKQPTCPKATRIENYLLYDCSEFAGYGTVVTEDNNEDDEEVN